MQNDIESIAQPFISALHLMAQTVAAPVEIQAGPTVRVTGVTWVQNGMRLNARIIQHTDGLIGAISAHVVGGRPYARGSIRETYTGPDDLPQFQELLKRIPEIIRLACRPPEEFPDPQLMKRLVPAMQKLATGLGGHLYLDTWDELYYVTVWNDGPIEGMVVASVNDQQQINLSVRSFKGSSRDRPATHSFSLGTFDPNAPVEIFEAALQDARRFVHEVATANRN